MTASQGSQNHHPSTAASNGQDTPRDSYGNPRNRSHTALSRIASFTNDQTSLHPPGNYIPSALLEKQRTLAEVGACVSSGVGGTLYCKKVPVRYRHPDLSNDVLKTVTVKVSAKCSTSRLALSFDGNNRRGNNSPSSSFPNPSLWNRLDSFGSKGALIEALSIELSDDDDPFTLLQLHSDGNDFLTLQQEQRLLVDFDTFPGMLIQLLESTGTNTSDVSMNDPMTENINPQIHSGSQVQEKDSQRDLSCTDLGSDNHHSPVEKRHSTQVEGGTEDSEQSKISFEYKTASNALIVGASDTSSSMVMNNCNNQKSSTGFTQNIDETRKTLSVSKSSRPSCSNRRSNEIISLVALLVCDCDDGETLPNSISLRPSITEVLESSFNSNYKRAVRSAVLSLIETNYFKELTHLSLRFTTATDQEMKQHLATRLDQWRVYSHSLENEMIAIDMHRKRWIEICGDMRKQCEKLQNELSGIQSQLKSKYEEEIQQLIDEHDKQMQTQKNALCEGRANLELRLTRQIESLSIERDSLQLQIEELLSQKSATEASERTLRRELNELKGNFASKVDELERLKLSSNQVTDIRKTLETENQSLRERVAADQAELLSLRAKVTTLEESVNQLTKQKVSLNELTDTSKTRITQLKEALEKTEAEIARGNEVIEKLQAALRKEKAKSKQMRDESTKEVVASTTLIGRVTELEEREKRLTSNETVLKNELDEVKKKLMEAEHTVKGQQKTIESLEQQLTERTVEAVLLSSTNKGSLSRNSTLPSVLSSAMISKGVTSPSSVPLPNALAATVGSINCTSNNLGTAIGRQTKKFSSFSAGVLTDSFNQLLKTCSSNMPSSIVCPQRVPSPVRLDATSFLGAVAENDVSSTSISSPSTTNNLSSSNQNDKTVTSVISTARKTLSNCSSSMSSQRVPSAVTHSAVISGKDSRLPSTSSSVSKEHQQSHSNLVFNEDNFCNGEMSFGRRHSSTPAPLPAIVIHETNVVRQQAEDNGTQINDELDSLNYSTSTLESSGAPHFGARRVSLSNRSGTSNDDDESRILSSVITWDSSIERERCIARETSSRSSCYRKSKSLSASNPNERQGGNGRSTKKKSLNV